jgi:phage tail sheath protein FI
MAKDDANFAPWFAPAGFTRGKFPTPVLDIAVSPSQRNRDLLYKQGINPITKFPNDGITVFGQKTKLSTPSAFDRINVRRLFLYLEKVTRTTLKYFVFEPNTLFTRTNVVNVLNPIFENVKNNQGMYDYLIVCDARNNTPTVIDNNQLVVDIYIKPTRSAEFILVNFYATRTDQNFNELV